MPSHNYSTIQGLNIVHPLPDESTSSETKDFLANTSEFPDFTSQLDLWTNLSFSSDEPTFISDASRGTLDFRNSSVDMDKDPQSVLIANTDKLPSSVHLGAPSPTPAPVPSSNFDISSFLAGFGIDPFLVPPQPSSPQFNQLNSSITNISTTPEAENQGQRANKRPRTRKQSVTLAVTPIITRSEPLITTASSSTAGSPPSTTSTLPEGSAAEGTEESPNYNAANISAAEDKRRRNTAASARFRAKKKEREQAMEKRSKELESRVNELERECEGLRRENGWLKGLVVGVTSGNPVPIPPIDEPSSLASQSSSSSSTAIAQIIATPTTASQDSAKKRKRELTHEP